MGLLIWIEIRLNLHLNAGMLCPTNGHSKGVSIVGTKVCLLFWNTVMFLSTELPSRNFCVRERMRTTKHHCYKPSFRVLLLKSSIWAMTFKYLWIEKRLKETPSSIMTWTALCTSRRPPHNTSVGSNNREIFVVLLLHKQIWCHF